MYPNYWRETIRGLLVHSADWTDTMLASLRGTDFTRANNAEKQALLRTFGYGVPILESARYSGGNSLTLIAENQIQPYRLEGYAIKYNEYNLYRAFHGPVTFFLMSWVRQMSGSRPCCPILLIPIPATVSMRTDSIIIPTAWILR